MISQTVSHKVSRDKIVDMFSAASVGSIVTYDELSDAVGFPIRSRRYLLSSCITKLARRGILFLNIINEGYRRLENSQTNKTCVKDTQKIKRISTHRAKSIGAVLTVANDLTNSQTKELLHYQTKFGMTALLSQEKYVFPIKDTATKPLSVKIAAAAFFEMLNTGRTKEA